jgi:hypothetical protein
MITSTLIVPFRQIPLQQHVKGVDLTHLVNAAFAHNKADHDKHWALLDQKVKDYLKDVPKEAYCTSFAISLGVQVNGETTSNRVEHAMNQCLQEGIRHECVFMGMVRTVALNGRLFFESREVCGRIRESGNILIPWAQEYYKDVKDKSAGHYVVNTNGGLGNISVSFNGQEEYRRVVNLLGEKPECTCELQESIGCVCAHIIVAIQTVGPTATTRWANAEDRLRAFFHKQYFAEEYLLAYESIPPVQRPRLATLRSDQKTLPPVIASSVKAGKGGSRRRFDKIYFSYNYLFYYKMLS